MWCPATATAATAATATTTTIPSPGFLRFSERWQLEKVFLPPACRVVPDRTPSVHAVSAGAPPAAVHGGGSKSGGGVGGDGMRGAEAASREDNALLGVFLTSALGAAAWRELRSARAAPLSRPLSSDHPKNYADAAGEMNTGRRGPGGGFDPHDHPEHHNYHHHSCNNNNNNAERDDAALRFRLRALQFQHRRRRRGGGAGAFAAAMASSSLFSTASSSSSAAAAAATAEADSGARRFGVDTELAQQMRALKRGAAAKKAPSMMSNVGITCNHNDDDDDDGGDGGGNNNNNAHSRAQGGTSVTPQRQFEAWLDVDSGCVSLAGPNYLPSTSGWIAAVCVPFRQQTRHYYSPVSLLD